MVKYKRATHSQFAALSDPSRVSIVEHLARGEASVSELAEPLRLSLPAIAKHLRALHAAGLISSRKDGRTRICRLETKQLRQMEHWLEDRRRLWEANLDSLERHLAERSKK